MASQCGVADRVVFTGSRDDIPDQLRELDLFVLASLREGRPTADLLTRLPGVGVERLVASVLADLRGTLVSGLVLGALI